MIHSSWIIGKLSFSVLKQISYRFSFLIQMKFPKLVLHTNFGFVLVTFHTNRVYRSPETIRSSSPKWTSEEKVVTMIFKPKLMSMRLTFISRSSTLIIFWSKFHKNYKKKHIKVNLQEMNYHSWNINFGPHSM